MLITASGASNSSQDPFKPTFLILMIVSPHSGCGSQTPRLLMTNILHYSQSLLHQTTPNLLSCITSILPISRLTSLLILNCAPGWILGTSCPNPSPFHTKILSSCIVFLHSAVKTCHPSSSSITHRCSTSCPRYFQFIALNAVFCPSSCPYCQPWHIPPQGGNICSNTHPLVVIERLPTKKYRLQQRYPPFWYVQQADLCP